MERVIKFRAFDLDNHNMYYSDRPENNGEGDIVWILDEKGIHFEEPIFDFWPEPDSNKMHMQHTKQVVMQFTGLLDKNGKEIYEGDLFSGITALGGKVLEIKWNNAKSGYSLWCMDTWYELMYLTMREVIGNVFENPDLIK